MFKLRDILAGGSDVWEIVSFPELCLGYYYEEKVWDKVEPSGPRWNVKKARPFIVIKSTEKHVYMILLTSLKENLFPCDLDKRYGIGRMLPKVYLKECGELNERCRWVEKESQVFKRKTGRKTCHIVLRMSKVMLAKNSVVCGECSKEVFNRQMWFVIEEELEGWRRKG